MATSIPSPNTRKQRDRRAATFLESIRETLLNISEEIQGIKLNVKAIQNQQSVIGQLNGFSATFGDVWQGWTAWDGYGDATTELNGDISLSCLDPHASPFVPPISRETLLHYRGDFLPCPVPLEISSLKVSTVGTNSGLSHRSLDLAERLATPPTVSLHWVPREVDIFVPGSPLLEEVRAEAALRIQDAYRRYILQHATEPGVAPVEDEQLQVVWLPLAEWRLATGMVNLSSECLSTWYVHGQRDYDTMLWLRITEETDREVGRLMEPDEMKKWYARILADSEEHCRSQARITARIAEVVLEWSRVRLHVPLQARAVVAHGIFHHVDTLRKVAHNIS